MLCWDKGLHQNVMMANNDVNDFIAKSSKTLNKKFLKNTNDSLTVFCNDTLHCYINATKFY